MAIDINDTITPVQYIPISQEKEETPAEFTLEPITGDRWFEISCEWVRDNNSVKLSFKGMQLALAHGLKGWKNVTYKGSPLEFNLLNISKLRSDDKYDLAIKVVEISQLLERQEKN